VDRSHRGHYRLAAHRRARRTRNGRRKPDGRKIHGLATGKTLIIELITEVGEEVFGTSDSGQAFRKAVRLGLIGELRALA
jgi:hypothetical protein